MIAYFLGRFKYALRHASQIGKLASSVNLYRFTHFLDFPSGAIFANLLVEEASPIPFERYLRYRRSFILNVFLRKKKPELPFGIQVKILIPFDYSYFSIQPIKVLTFSRSSSFMVLSFSHKSRYGVFVSSSGAKNSAGVISKYEIILNSSLRDGKAAPLVIPRMYEPLLSKSKLILCSEIFFAILSSVILIRINSSYCVLATSVPPSSIIVV